MSKQRLFFGHCLFCYLFICLFIYLFIWDYFLTRREIKFTVQSPGRKQAHGRNFSGKEKKQNTKLVVVSTLDAFFRICKCFLSSLNICVHSHIVIGVIALTFLTVECILWGKPCGLLPFFIH